MQDELDLMVKSYYDDWFQINKIYYEWAKTHGISQKALFVLFEIMESKVPCTQHAICERTSYQKQTVSQIIHGLEKQGLIICVTHEHDKRKKIVRLTERGLETAEKLSSVLKCKELEAFGSMTVEEREMVVRGFRILADALHHTFKKIQ